MYNEIQSLVLNLNIEIIIKEIIKIKQKNPSTFLGKGNLLRLKEKKALSLNRSNLILDGWKLKFSSMETDILGFRFL